MKITKKVTIIGFFAYNTSFSGGQENKTRSIYEYCIKEYGIDNVLMIDTYHWKKKPFKVFHSTIKAIRQSKNILICPSKKGIQIFAPIVYFFANKKKQGLYYAVIGAWLPYLLEKKRFLRFILKKYRKIFIETQFANSKLVQLGFNNSCVMYNAREIEKTSMSNIKMPSNPIKICTFSRVEEKKGIIDAIKAVEEANLRLKSTCFSLCIFGQIENSFKDTFNECINSFPNFIEYGGQLDNKTSTSVLSNFDILLFPTKYSTEGFPGTFLDGFAAGLCIVSSNIPSAIELIENGINGFLFQMGNIGSLADLLVSLFSKKDEIFLIKKQNLEYCNKFTVSNVYKQMTKSFL